MHRFARMVPSPVFTGEEKDISFSRRGFFRVRVLSNDDAIHLVTTGLDPVVHADVRLQKTHRQVLSALFSAWIAGSSPAMTK
jgi:hypothetical protein